MKALLLTLCLPCLASAVTFETWIAAQGLTGADAALTADPDHDRLDNLTEYVLADGDADTAGPWDIEPRFGWSVALADGGFGEQSATPPNGAPIGAHVCLNYELRAGIENVTVEALVSMPCPASNSDGSLMRWVGGQSLVKVLNAANGRLQAVCKLRSDLMPRAFMKLQITHGAGRALPPVEGTAEPTLQLNLGNAGHVYRTVGSPTNTNVTNQDVSYSQTSLPQVVTDVQWPWALGSSGYDAEDITRSSSNLGVLAPTVGNTQLWTYQADGSAWLRIITPDRTYERFVSAFTSPGAVVSRTQGTSTSGSLRRHCDSTLDGYMSSHSSFAERGQVFSDVDHVTPSYTRNANFWLEDVDTTPVAAWNSNGAQQKGPTLITPRHVIGAVHHAWTVGTTVHFVEADNDVVVRTITDVATIAGTDILLGKLNSDVPAGIDFAKILPSNWAAKLPTLAVFGMPVCTIDQGKRAWVRNVRDIGANVVCTEPNVSSRIPFYKEMVGGDSGSPCFAVVGNEMVLLCCWYGGGGGSGPSVLHNATAIDAALTSLGGGYSLTTVNLGSYTTF